MKRTLLTLTLFVCNLALGLAQNEVPQLTSVLSRESMSLNGKWHYIIDVQEEGYYDYRHRPMRDGFFLNAKPKQPEDLIEYDFDKAATMQVPGDWNTQDERLFFYEGTVWFKTSFQAQVPIENYRTLLYFGAVNYDCRVWVNGKAAGHHEGGFTPFNFDVTNLLRNGENTVVVKVDNTRKAENVPTLIFDWWNYGGITRDVMLVRVPPTYIEHYKLQLEKAEAKARKRTLTLTAHLNKAEEGSTLTLAIPELKVRQQCTTDAQGNARMSVQVPAKRLELWSPENPRRYQVELSLNGNAATSQSAPSADRPVVSDFVADSIGFRTIETRGKQLLLNGEPIFLRGISIHEEKPNGGGRANSTDDAHTLLTWAKELGCNFVRLAHYPHNEYAVREAERMGMLVWSEIPCYWTIDWTNAHTLDNARQQVTDMIRRDQNRANVIIWSIANETPHSAERDRFLESLAQQARSLDTTRLISMAMEVTSASNFHNVLNDNMNKYVDVVSFNQYIGWYRDVNDAAKMTWEIPYDKPVIISEFGGGAKYGLHGAKNQRWTEEFQENLYRENIQMISKIDGLAGTTPWILKDFRSPRRVLNGIQDYYNRKGLYSDKGEKKKAFYVLREWYEGKRQAALTNKKK